MADEAVFTGTVISDLEIVKRRIDTEVASEAAIWNRALVAAEEAVWRCASLDTEGYLCEKRLAIIAVQKLRKEPPP